MDKCYSEMTLAQLIGILLTDGGVSKASKNLYEIYITNNSETLLNLFKVCICELFGQQKFYEYKSKTVRKVKFTSDRIAAFLFAFSSSYRTRRCDTYPRCSRVEDRIPCSVCLPDEGYPPVKIPDFISNGTAEIKKKFLKVAFSAEGCVEFYENKYKNKAKTGLQRRVSLSCYNPNLLKQYSDMLKSLGYKISITKTEIRITGKEQLAKFSNEIGFLNDVYVSSKSKYWNNFDKNELLRLVLSSYLNTKSQSKEVIAGSFRNVSQHSLIGDR